MSPAHEAWIAAYAARHGGYVGGRCRSAVVEMQQAFPDLVEKRGHVESLDGRRGHAWLETSEGEIVDPTASQFMLISHYDEWKPGDVIDVGKCMHCGDRIRKSVRSLGDVRRESVCSASCETKLLRDLNGGEP